MYAQMLNEGTLHTCVVIGRYLLATLWPGHTGDHQTLSVSDVSVSCIPVSKMPVSYQPVSNKSSY